MDMRTLWLSLLVLVLIIPVGFVGCAEPSSPIPEIKPVPSPRVVDEPSLSEDEVSAYIWSHLPKTLPEGHEKTQLSRDTGTVTYLGNGKWRFEASGSVETREPFDEGIRESSKEAWLEWHSERVTTYELKLTADFYEKIRVLEILNIEKFNEQSQIDISEKPIYPELLVEWLIEEHEGERYRFEGSVKNTGKMNPGKVQIEATYTRFDSTTTLIKRDYLYAVVIYGERIAGSIIPSGTAHFLLEFREETGFYLHSFKFLLPSGLSVRHELSEEAELDWLGLP